MAGGRKVFDVIVVGGGPAGSTLAWDLARSGVEVLLLERTRFPREKVCGDYVEPRGLRILEEMGCLAGLEARGALPVTHSATFVEWECRYRGPIPFYGTGDGLPPHGYILPREDLDAAMLAAAVRAGATVHEETSAASLRILRGGVEVEARGRARTVRHRARLVAGADGVNSIVGKAAGLLAEDDRHIAVAQRAYAQGADGDVGEAVFCFDRRLFPGYGWMFPMAGGRVNMGVGVLGETRRRLGLHVPTLFREFVDGLRRSHPRCGGLELCSAPIGGIVKTYGSAGPNHFDRGVLVGDAGSFVDPMTGEGITPGMESALLAAPALRAALQGREPSRALSEYETAFRRYFDPAMVFLDLCAATLRNPHLARPWLKALARGCDVAQGDRPFARTAGSYFGGLDVRPYGILGHMWGRIVLDLALLLPRLLSRGAGGSRRSGTTVADLLEWHTAWSRSLMDDPLWHLRWTMDVQRKWVRLLATTPARGRDPRAGGWPVGTSP